MFNGIYSPILYANIFGLFFEPNGHPLFRVEDTERMPQSTSDECRVAAQEESDESEHWTPCVLDTQSNIWTPGVSSACTA